MSARYLALLIFCALVLQQMLPAATVTATAEMTAAAVRPAAPGFDVPHETSEAR